MTATNPLSLDVFVLPYKPIVGLIAPMGKGNATWPATAVSLISGERDAVLIDAAMTLEDARQIVDWIRATGKNLTTIYITHGHADHFFGLNTLLAAFPDARAVTEAAVVPEAQGQLSPELMWFWNAIFPGQIPEHPIVPDALDDRLHPEPGRRHLRDFNQSLSESDSAQELVDRMMVPHGDLGNPYTLWTAAQGVFEQGQGGSS